MFNVLIVCCLSAVCIAAIICFSSVCKKAFEKDTQSTATSFGQILKGGNFLKIATVFIVSLDVTFLALAEKINSHAVIAIFSSIIGYVLGSLEKN